MLGLEEILMVFWPVYSILERRKLDCREIRLLAQVRDVAKSGLKPNSPNFLTRVLFIKCCSVNII